MILRGGQLKSGMVFLNSDLERIHDAYINNELDSCIRNISYKTNNIYDYNLYNYDDFIHSFVIKIEKLNCKTLNKLKDNIDKYNTPIYYEDKNKNIEQCKIIFIKFADLDCIIKIAIKPFALVSNNLILPSTTPCEEFVDIDDNSCFVSVDINNKEIELKHNYDEQLLVFKKYFQNELENLEKKKELKFIELSLKLYRTYFTEFMNLSGDETQYIIPVLNKVENFKNITLKIVDNNNDEFSCLYMDIKLSSMSKEENKSCLEKLLSKGITLNKETYLCSVILGGNQHENRDFLKRITNDTTVKCYIGENIEGDKTRIKRIIFGIDRVLSGNVVNKELVDEICSNDILSKYNKTVMNSYVSDMKYIKYLKQTYPKIKDNISQLEAIDKIMQMRKNNVPLMLLQGPPGTGKTELILVLAKELSLHNKNTLISSNVHIACDNVSDRLKNEREIILKKYSSYKKGFDIKYQAEIIENQLRYLKNQVLSGYEYNGNVINSIDRYKKLSNLFNDYKIRIDKMDNDFSKESKYFEKYNELCDKYNGCLIEVEDYNEELSSYKNKLVVLKETLKDKLHIISNLSKQIDHNKTKFDKVNNEKEELTNKEQEYSTLKDELDKRISKLKKAIEYNKKFQKNKESNRISIQKLIDKNETDLNYLNQLDLEKELEHFIMCIKKEKKLNTKYFNYFDNSEYYKILNTIKLLKEDFAFWNKSSNISLNTLMTIKYNEDQFYLKPIDNYSDIYDKIEYLCDYSELSKLSRIKVRLFNVKIKEISKDKTLLFESDVNNYFSMFKNKIDYLANKIFETNYNGNKLKDKYNKLYIDSISNLNKFDEKISKLNDEIENQEKEYESSIKELNTLNNEMNDIHIKIETITESYNDLFNTIEELNSNKNENDKEKDSIEKEIRNILDSVSDIKKKITSKNSELSIYKSSIDKIESNDSIRLRKYKKYKKKYIKDRKKLVDKYESISRFMESFNKRIDLLTDDNSLKGKYYNIIFNYANELDEINIDDINYDSREIAKFIDGKGNSFKNEFKLDTKGSYNLISMTTNQISQLFRMDDSLEFDYAIIDEASKCSFEDIIISLPRIKNLILIGDYMQLNKKYDRFKDISPEQREIIKTEELWTKLNKSTFSMLFKQIVEFNEKNDIDSYNNNIFISALSGQYRMNKGIYNLISPIYSIHKGLEIEDKKDVESNDVKCISIDGTEEKIGHSFMNNEEIDSIIDILKLINDNREMYPNINTIGVITGYDAQVNHIRMRLKEKIKGLEIGTFDRFQGKEFDLVIVSLVRTGDVEPPSIGFLKDIRRMNVAFSRSKNHLIILGNINKIMNISNNYVDNTPSNSISEKEENEFVFYELIPTLNRIKEVFPSQRSRLESIDEFLKENDYE